jgi:hypothetical protein
MRDAEEVIVIKQIRGKRLTADLEFVLTGSEIARQAAQSEAGEILRNAPPHVVNAFKDLVETCRHENGKFRDSRSLGDVIQSFVPMVVAERLDQNLHSSIRLYYQENDPYFRKLEVLKEAVALLQHLHIGREELAAESARIVAACGAFCKAYSKR